MEEEEEERFALRAPVNYSWHWLAVVLFTLIIGSSRRASLELDEIETERANSKNSLVWPCFFFFCMSKCCISVSLYTATPMSSGH
jgi:hypothetical protein